MRNALFVLFFLSSLNIYAMDASDCQVRLLGAELDSSSYYVNADDFESSLDADAKAFAREAVGDVRAQVGCAMDKALADKVYCQELKRGDESSLICMLDASEGRYLIAPDFLGNARVVFNRWD